MNTAINYGIKKVSKICLRAYVVSTATGFKIMIDDTQEQGITYDFDYIITEALEP